MFITYTSAVTRHVEMKGVTQKFVYQLSCLAWIATRTVNWQLELTWNFFFTPEPTLDLICDQSCSINYFYFQLLNQFCSLHLLIMHYQINDHHSPQPSDIQQWLQFPFLYYWSPAGKGESEIPSILFSCGMCCQDRHCTSCNKVVI
jgi:hypothetical protein